MRFSVLIEEVKGSGEPEGMYYASVPSLGLVTHGLGVESALEAAHDLTTLWLEQARENGEDLPEAGTALLASMEIG
jgi:predicted RNase H-like HicB family nuclease